MTDPKRTVPSTVNQVNDTSAAPAASGLAVSGVNGSQPSDAKPIKELTAEEQMALYEQDLKENDWGHQPC